MKKLILLAVLLTLSACGKKDSSSHEGCLTSIAGVTCSDGLNIRYVSNVNRVDCVGSIYSQGLLLINCVDGYTKSVRYYGNNSLQCKKIEEKTFDCKEVSL